MPQAISTLVSLSNVHTRRYTPDGLLLSALSLPVSPAWRKPRCYPYRCLRRYLRPWRHLRNRRAFPAIAAAIDRIIDRHGEIKDNASPELAEIRRAISACAGSINSAMRRVIANAVRDGFLEGDVTPSVRDGRLVIPVAPMYKRKINGIVHDESASGKTFFIEPAEVVEANTYSNRLVTYR